MNDTSVLQTQFPANVPPKLIELFHQENDQFRPLARRLDVNPKHIWDLLVNGKEPVHPDIRAKLFLPAKVRPPLAAWVGQATDALAALEEKAGPAPNRTYSRKGKRVR